MATRNPYSESSPDAEITSTTRYAIRSSPETGPNDDEGHNDRFNYALLIALYTLQGIPMGLSASIPFLIQQKVKQLALASMTLSVADTVATVGPLSEAAAAAAAASASASASQAATRLSYNANAMFALCSWPFSLKLLWAPVVDAIFFKSLGRRKSWLVPVQLIAGLLMVGGANFVERQLGMSDNINVAGLTAFFFVLYFLMATQDVAVDGWALTLLSKRNRGRGPVCNSIGQNSKCDCDGDDFCGEKTSALLTLSTVAVGYFLSFVGFLALNDVESSERFWRPWLGLPSNPQAGVVSLGGFIKFMGYFMLTMTTLVALCKHETTAPVLSRSRSYEALLDDKTNGETKTELDASEIGLKETYFRLWQVCKLPSVRWLFLVLLTYRLPTALSDNVKFLKAVEFGLSKSATALLSPTIILPLGILVPIVATKIWHNHPMRQFMMAYRVRVTLVPLLDSLMLYLLRRGFSSTSSLALWAVIVLSTAAQATVNSLQFNSQMTFFAHRVDPAIGGTYMTLLNTAANLGGTWPASAVMWLVSLLTKDVECKVVTTETGSKQVCSGRDPYFLLQFIFSLLGLGWIALMGNTVRYVAELPDDAWRTHLLDDQEDSLKSVDVELGETPRWDPKDGGKRE